MEFQRHISRKKRGLNLTSLIDIIFLLVIFFMLTSQYISYGLVNFALSKSKLAKDSNSDENQELFIELAADHSFIMDGQEYHLSELEKKLQILKDNGIDFATHPFVLISRPGVLVQDIIIATQYIKDAGGTNVSLLKVKY